MKRLRTVLRESHVAAVTIAVLMFWTIVVSINAVFGPLAGIASYLLKAILILDIPSFDVAYQLYLINSGLYLLNLISLLGAAWAFSRWVYGVGPVGALRQYGKRIPRRKHA